MCLPNMMSKTPGWVVRNWLKSPGLIKGVPIGIHIDLCDQPAATAASEITLPVTSLILILRGTFTV